MTGHPVKVLQTHNMVSKDRCDTSGGGGCPFQASKLTGGQGVEADAGSSSSDGEGGGDNQMMLTSDMVLVWDAGMICNNKISHVILFCRN